MINNSKTYWDNTIDEFGNNICGCDCLNVEKQEDNIENDKGDNKNDIIEIDNLFTDKRNNIGSFNGILNFF